MFIMYIELSIPVHALGSILNDFEKKNSYTIENVCG